MAFIVFLLIATGAVIQSASAAPATLTAAEAEALDRLASAETAVEMATARVAELERETATQRHDAEAAKRALKLAKHHLAAARAALGERLVLLYRIGNPDPVAAIFGAGNLTIVLDELDAIRRSINRDAELVRQTSGGATRALTAERALTTSQTRLQELLDQAQASELALVDERNERRGTLADIRQRLTKQQGVANKIEAAAVDFATEATAINVEAGTTDPTPTAEATTPARPTGGLAPGTTLYVKATAYAGMQGTATGVSTRHGICATDPSVIPMGTRFEVPGYGTCIAADTGGAVIGNFIDVWMPEEGPALQWGIKYLTIRFL